MAKEYLIRAMGHNDLKDIGPMTLDEAKKQMKEMFDAFIASHEWIDLKDYTDNEIFIDPSGMAITIAFSEMYQSYEIVPANTQTGIEYHLEEIVREAGRADISADWYKCEMKESYVEASTAAIREHVEAIRNMCGISFDVNNGDRIVWHIQQDEPSGTVIVSKCDKVSVPTADGSDAQYGIPAAEFVMLLNLYRYIKENDIQDDFINPNGKENRI